MAVAPSVAIVLVNYNSSAYIDSLLDSLLALTYPAWRLVAVDNASSDGSGDRIAERIPSAVVVRNGTNAGFAPAVNIGFGIALKEGADYVMLLNPDTTFGPDLIEKLVAASDSRRLVVPKVLDGEGRIMGHAGRFDWLRGLQVDTHDGNPDGPAEHQPRDIDTGSFSCMLMPTEAVRAAGPLDERLAFYYEDTDFVERARRTGFGLRYEPSAVLHHAEGSSSGGRASPFAVYYGTRNRPFVVKKYLSRTQFAMFTAYYLSTRAVRCAELLRRRDWTQLSAVLRGVRDYYQGRMGMRYTPSELRGKSNRDVT